MRAKLLSLALATTLAAALVGTVACQPQASGPAADRVSDTANVADLPDPTDQVRPIPESTTNVIVVVVDDANDIRCSETQKFLPKMSRLLRDHGTCFENATVTSPACCPSRANLMTSQMGHNSGVARQVDASRLRIEDTLQDDLTTAGWDTYGTGKFFNGVSPWTYESGEKSSGFLTSDFWASSKYYDYDLWDDVTQTHHKPAQRVHATVQAGRFLRQFITSERGSVRPFYAYVAFKAPHTDNSAPNRALRYPKPTPANADRPVPPFKYRPEADLRDKLPIYRGKLSSRAYLERLYTTRTRAIYDVDDELAETVGLLSQEGILDRTAILFTSDNGYHLGENGWETKGDPYQRAMDVPLLAWLPSAFAADTTDTRPVGVIDIAPTVYDLLGVTPDHALDGRSLLSSYRRTGTFFELENEKSAELYKEAGYAPGRIPTWAMYREGTSSYIEYYRPDGSKLRSEFYTDKRFMKNLLWRGFRAQRPSGSVLSHFRARLQAGRSCAGTVEQGSTNPCP